MQLYETLVRSWISDARCNLAHATVSALSVLDFESVVIDGALPVQVKDRLVAEVRDQLEKTDLQGVHRPEIEAGTLGHRARTLGAAATLISAEYMNELNPIGA
ncbi:ROK family protein [Labrenzia sp. PHM005]|nr:ROK family protein [Labrenzia sp. PHM005]